MDIDQNMLAQLPPEYRQQLEAVLRKREMARALQQRALQGPIMPQQGQVASRLNPLAALAPVIQGYLGERMDKSASEEIPKIQQQANDSTQFDINQLLTAPDQKNAIARAMMGNNPRTQAYAKLLQDQLIAKQKQEAEFAQQSKIQGSKTLGENGDVAAALTALKTGLPENYQPQPLPDPEIRTYTGPDGKSLPYALTTNRKGEKGFHNLGGGPSANVSIGDIGDKGKKAGLEKMFELMATDVAKKGEAASSALQLKDSLAQLSALDEKGVVSGPAANPSQWLLGVGRALGIPVDEGKLANSQAYSAIAQEAVQRVIGANGGNRNVTKEEAALIAQMIPQLQSSPEARVKLTSILHNITDRSVERYRKSQENYNNAFKSQDPTGYDFSEVGAPSLPTLPPVRGNDTKIRPEDQAKREDGRLAILREELKTAKTAEDRAAIQREIDRTTSANSPFKGFRIVR